MKLLQTLLGMALVGACVAASAQWQWIDKDGRKVFSDRAPPVDVLDKNIVKRPQSRGPSTPAAEAAATAGAEAAQANPGAASPTVPTKGGGVDKELEAKKKQATDAEIAKRKAEEERVTKAKIENCARAKQGKTAYDSGVRISRLNAAGEKEILDDAARAEELKRIQSVIAADCK